jgi:tetratricopeptide (TPR) repeat protein
VCMGSSVSVASATNTLREAPCLFKSIYLPESSKDEYTGRGWIYYIQGKYAEAIADYTRVIIIDSKAEEAYAQRGALYKLQGKYNEAIADYDKAIELGPEFAGYYTGRGNAYASSKEFDRAIADYQKSISLDPAPYTYCVLGITYTKIGDFSSAISNLEQGVQLDTKSENPWCKTALDNARLGTPTP